MKCNGGIALGYASFCNHYIQQSKICSVAVLKISYIYDKIKFEIFTGIFTFPVSITYIAEE